MDNSIEERIKENRENEDRLLEMLHLLDNDKDEATKNFQSDRKDLDKIAEGWKGVMARRYLIETEEKRTEIHENMCSLIERQRDEIHRKLNQIREEREELLAERREADYEQYKL